jgi:hypothetical protein
MMRRIAIVGDTLDTHREIFYSGPGFAAGYSGHQVALIGGKAWREIGLTAQRTSQFILVTNRNRNV